jgi:hypothetical protein
MWMFVMVCSGATAFVPSNRKLASVRLLHPSDDDDSPKPSTAFLETRETVGESALDNVSSAMRQRLLEEASNTCGCSTKSLSKRRTKKTPTQLLVVLGVGLLAMLVAAEEGMLSFT